MLSIPLPTQDAILAEKCPAFGVNPGTGNPCLAFNTMRVEKGRLVFKYNDIEVSDMALGDEPAEITFSGVLDINITLVDHAPEQEPSEIEPVTD